MGPVDANNVRIVTLANAASIAAMALSSSACNGQSEVCVSSPNGQAVILVNGATALMTSKIVSSHVALANTYPPPGPPRDSTSFAATRLCITRVKYDRGTLVVLASSLADMGVSGLDVKLIMSRNAYSAVFEIIMGALFVIKK
jgi:hypothetical protein